MPSPYQRIMKAAQAGRGVRLTAAEVQDLSLDDAISTAAENDDDAQDALACPGHEWGPWRTFPHRPDEWERGCRLCPKVDASLSPIRPDATA